MGPDVTQRPSPCISSHDAPLVPTASALKPSLTSAAMPFFPQVRANELPDQMSTAGSDAVATSPEEPTVVSASRAGCNAELLALNPRSLVVEGVTSRRLGAPAESPRSGVLKRKHEEDRLCLNGVYVLREAPHNGAGCWEKRGAELRVIFRSEDGLSWVIDEEVHAGDPEDLVLARLVLGAKTWAPQASLTLRAPPDLLAC